MVSEHMSPAQKILAAVRTEKGSGKTTEELVYKGYPVRLRQMWGATSEAF